MLWNTDVQYIVDQTYDSMLQSIFHFTFISTKLSELGSSMPRQFCAVAQPNRAIFEPLTSVENLWRDVLSRRWVFQGWCHQVSCATCERCCCLVPSFLMEWNHLTIFHLYFQNPSFLPSIMFPLVIFFSPTAFTQHLSSQNLQVVLSKGQEAPLHLVTMDGELPMTSHDQWMLVMPSTVLSLGSSVVRA